jgi:hypothetical protein
MSLEELRELHGRGWTIANHTWEHKQVADRFIPATMTGANASTVSSYAISRPAGSIVDVVEASDVRMIGQWAVTSSSVTNNDPSNVAYGTGNIGFTVATAPGDTVPQCYARVPGMTDQQVIDNYLNRNREWCIANGLVRGSDLAIYPNGTAPRFLWPALSANGYRAARSTRINYRQTVSPTVFGTYMDISGLHTIDGWVSEYDLPIFWIDAGGTATMWDTAAEFLAHVDNCIASGGGTLMPYGHAFTGTGANNYSPTEAAALFAGIRDREMDGLLEVVGFDRWLEQMGI